MTREHIQREDDRPLSCAAREAFRCRPDALSDDEKTILSAIVLQKGEAEALYEYMHLGALGCRYEDEHPGVFIGSDYVQYPAAEQKQSMEMQVM